MTNLEKKTFEHKTFNFMFTVWCHMHSLILTFTKKTIDQIYNYVDFVCH